MCSMDIVGLEFVLPLSPQQLPPPSFPGVLRSPLPAPSTAGQSVCPGSSRTLRAQSSSSPAGSAVLGRGCSRGWAGGRLWGCPRGRGAEGPAPSGRDSLCGATGKEQRPRRGGAEPNQRRGSAVPAPAPQPRRWAAQLELRLGAEPWQPHPLQLPWSCSKCCWLPFCSRSCLVSTPRTDPGGGKAGCHPVWMQRLSSAEVAAVLGGMCEGSSAPKLSPSVGRAAVPLPTLTRPLSMVLAGQRRQLVVCVVSDLAPSSGHAVWISGGNGSILQSFAYGASQEDGGTVCSVSLLSSDPPRERELACHVGANRTSPSHSSSPIRITGNEEAAELCSTAVSPAPALAALLMAVRVVLLKVLLSDAVLTSILLAQS
ncbi:pre T-cell antigen receptor alpha [Parus major]|uniref:pre T-cell antigen receptor alpha n=1 Tax=Parus major TaxID=9157 RepID=UPI0014442E5D|nr:pre T-cell antigen receptor alpha [Parus major]XP_015478475.2 pre T-cell antigen receptor alpha [Parus major]